MFSNDQSFSILLIAVSALEIADFLLCNDTDHGCFSYETVIFVQDHAKCIKYQFWVFLKNLLTLLNQSLVSMTISEKSEDVNPVSAIFKLFQRWPEIFIDVQRMSQFFSVLLREFHKCSVLFKYIQRWSEIYIEAQSSSHTFSALLRDFYKCSAIFSHFERWLDIFMEAQSNSQTFSALLSDFYKRSAMFRHF